MSILILGDTFMKIKNLRTINNILPKTMSKILNLSINSYYQKERGDRKFTAIEIQKICEFFDVSINELDLNPNDSSLNNLDIRKK